MMWPLKDEPIKKVRSLLALTEPPGTPPFKPFEKELRRMSVDGLTELYLRISILVRREREDATNPVKPVTEKPQRCRGCRFPIVPGEIFCKECS